MNDEEIESMLDERLPAELKNKKKEYEERFKTVMEGKQALFLTTTLFKLICYRKRKESL